MSSLDPIFSVEEIKDITTLVKTSLQNANSLKDKTAIFEIRRNFYQIISFFEEASEKIRILTKTMVSDIIKRNNQTVDISFFTPNNKLTQNFDSKKINLCECWDHPFSHQECEEELCNCTSEDNSDLIIIEYTTPEKY